MDDLLKQYIRYVNKELDGITKTHREIETLAILLGENYKIAVDALKDIRKNEGKVCVDFELCKHVACQSSCSSWFIAEKALDKLNEKGKENE